MRREPKPITEDEVRAAYAEQMGLDEQWFDPCAWTVWEIAERRKCNWNTANLLAKKNVRDGKWEQVIGKDSLGRPVRAFRPKKR